MKNREKKHASSAKMRAFWQERNGSRISRDGETVAAYGWGVYGIGEHSVDYWKAKHNSEVQIMASGGNMDWAPEYARSNTRAEQTHILAAMIQLFQTGINVLYSVDYTGGIYRVL